MSVLVSLHLILLTGLLGVALHVALNRRTLARLMPCREPYRGPRISVLIPARNEAGRIEACVRGWASQKYPRYEVIVYDDDSGDETAARALEAAGGAAHVRVIRGGPLPAGWRGKPHACHRLRHEATGDLLVFADADIRVAPAALGATVGALERLGVDALSAVPLHTGSRLLLRALASLQGWSALAFVPAWRSGRSRRGTSAAVNGQYLVLRAEVYEATGGFAAVRHSLSEDVAFGRRLAALGYRVPLLDGTPLLHCDAYRNLRELWRANVRNLVPIFFGSGALLAAAVIALALLFLGPPTLLALAALQIGPAPALSAGLAAAEIGIGLFARRVADVSFGYPWSVTLLHPLAVAALVGMGLDSAIRYRRRGRVAWRGRSYALRDSDAEH